MTHHISAHYCQERHLPDVRKKTNGNRNYADFVDHLREEWRQRVDITIETASKNKWLVKCEFDVSCETFRCKHENGDDIFVVNGCGKEKEPNNSTQCTLRTHLTDYCNMNKYPHSFPSCSQCYDQECNENRIKLTNPSDMTKKPNHCIHAFRHNKSYELDPKLEDMMASWQIFNLTLKYNHECLKYYPGCQTYRCKNEFGNDIFVVNGCATEHNEFKCAYKELDPFCLPQQNMYDHCEYCEGKSCNLNKIELETLYTFKSRATKATTRSTTATTTTDALDNETDEPESTKGPKKARANLMKKI
uniref:Peptidase M12A domain-containing protein n=1 Tax=Globodera pallida TaxID=36090 RepID=A0A183CM55_GLOPA